MLREEASKPNPAPFLQVLCFQQQGLLTFKFWEVIKATSIAYMVWGSNLNPPFTNNRGRFPMLGGVLLHSPGAWWSIIIKWHTFVGMCVYTYTCVCTYILVCVFLSFMCIFLSKHKIMIRYSLFKHSESFYSPSLFPPQFSISSFTIFASCYSLPQSLVQILYYHL